MRHEVHSSRYSSYYKQHKEISSISFSRNSSVIRRPPSWTSQTYCAPILICRSISLAAVPGSRVIVRWKPPSKSAKGQARGTDSVPRRGAAPRAAKKPG